MKRTLSVLFVFLLTFAAAAGERLPAGLLAHVSAKSLPAAATNLDALIVACVKDTPSAQQYKPGMLPMMLTAFAPFPQKAWDANAELHAVAAMVQGPQPVLILKTPGAAAFRKAMADGGVKLAGDDKKMSGQIPSLGGTWHFADAGGGRVACSPSEAARDFVVKALAAGWSPKHSGGADLAINLDLKNTLSAFKPIFDGYMGQARQALAGQGGGADRGKPLAAVMSKVATRMLAAFESDAPALNNLGIDLSFSGERLKLAFALSGDKGSGLDNLRAVYAAGEPPKYALANSFPKETALVDAMADLSKFPDGWVKFYEETLRDLGGVVMPDKANELAALPRQFLALGIKDYSAGSYLAGDRPVMAFYFEHGAAKKVQDFLPGALKLAQEFVNGLAKADGGDKIPSVGISYQAQAGKIGDVPYQRINFQVKPAGAGKAVGYDVLFALGGKTVAAVYGQVNERDLHYAIENYRRPADGFVNSEPARKAMADIGNRRIKFVELRPMETLANFYVGQAALTGTDMQAAQAAVAGLRGSPACLALASGATDRDLTLECVLPAEVAGDFIRNSGALAQLRGTFDSSSVASSSSSETEDGGDWEDGEDSERPGDDMDQPGDGTGDAADSSEPIQLAKPAFGPDDDVEVTVKGISEQMGRDMAFVGIFKAGAGHGERDRLSFFQMVEGENVVAFYHMKLEPGEYELRVYRKGHGFSEEDVFASTRFVQADIPPTLTLAKGEYRPGSQIGVTVRGANKRLRAEKAFVGLYEAGAPHDKPIQRYSPSRTNSTMLFDVPKKNGRYEIRFHKKDKDISDATVVYFAPFTVTGNAK